MTEAPVDSTPWTSDGPTPCPVSTTEDVPDGDILAQAMADAHIGVDDTPKFEAIPLPPTGPADPRYFFMALRAWRITLPMLTSFRRQGREPSVGGGTTATQCGSPP